MSDAARTRRASALLGRPDDHQIRAACRGHRCRPRSDLYVWAVDAEQSPSYWFPRQCPRAMAWIGPRTTVEDRERVLGPGGVVPLGPPAPVGDLFALHAAAGIQLRVLP